MKHVQTQDRRGRSIAFAAVGKHAYFYKDAHILASMVDSDTDFPEVPEASLSSETEPIIAADFEANNAPEVKEWLEWDGEIRPGPFYTDSLNEVRGILCSKGRSPKVSYTMSKDKGEEYSQLTIVCCEPLDGAKGTCVLDKNRENTDMARPH